MLSASEKSENERTPGDRMRYIPLLIIKKSYAMD